MQFFITQKSLGKRQSPDTLIDSVPVELDIGYDANSETVQISIKDLLMKLVAQQVSEFNQKIDLQIQKQKESKDASSVLSASSESQYSQSTLTQKDIDGYLFTLGKVDFSNIKNLTPIVLEEAIINALQAFEDGLFVMFVNDEEIQSLEQMIDVADGCHISFVKLTFLTGGWF